jgi:hypothetical protein
MNFKVEVRVVGENSFHSNGLVFATEDEAKRYGKDLWGRWFSVEEYRIAEVEDAVTCVWDFETDSYHLTEEA